MFFHELLGKRLDNHESSVGLIVKNLPTWEPGPGEKQSTISFYYWYYGSHALFQHGGKDWGRWNKRLKQALVKNQRPNGCEKGSWDPLGEWGAPGGRVYATALNALTLEVYYRYARVGAGSEK